jgi:hypothetical protein
MRRMLALARRNAASIPLALAPIAVAWLIARFLPP